MDLRSRRSRAVLLVLPVAALSWLLWWTLLRTVESVETVTVERGDIEASVTALGALQPFSYVDVGAQVSGQIRRIAAQAGGVVEKGALLVEIDPSIQQAKVDADRASLDSLRAQLAEAQAQRDLARQENERQQQMAAVDATRLQDVQSAEANLRVSVAHIENLNAQIAGAQSVLKGDEASLGYTRIFAPMTGTIVTLDAREGQTLNATYQTPTLLRLADLSRMTVWTEVSEADIGGVKPGMPVYFTTLGGRNEKGPRKWTGRVRQILPAPPHSQAQANDSGNAQAGAPSAAGKVVLYTVLFDVDNVDGALMPQMSAQVYFVVASATQVPVVPLSALQPVEGKPDTYTAQVLHDDHPVTRELHVGARDRLHAAVLSGVSIGEQLVVGIHRERAGAGRFPW